MPKPTDEIKQEVRKVYGTIAQQREASACCQPAAAQAALLRDYSAEEIATVPTGAYLGEGSGNPVRWAELKPGEMVVDLGSGAGMDVFLAANRVGDKGRVIGVDMTGEMVSRAVVNAGQGNYPQVEFRLADIEAIPLPDGTADAVLSNCVINLAPNKKAVFREAWRLLRPGGRLSIADIVRRPVAGAPASDTKMNPAEWCACLAGAMVEEEYFDLVRSVGFRDVRIVAERPAMSQPADGSYSARAITFTARKPDATPAATSPPPSTRATRARRRKARG